MRNSKSIRHLERSAHQMTAVQSEIYLYLVRIKIEKERTRLPHLIECKEKNQVVASIRSWKLMKSWPKVIP